MLRSVHRTGLNEDEVLLGEGEGEDDSDAPNTDDEDSNGKLKKASRSYGWNERRTDLIPSTFAEEDFYRNDYPEGDEDASDDADSNMSESDGGSD